MNYVVYGLYCLLHELLDLNLYYLETLNISLQSIENRRSRSVIYQFWEQDGMHALINHGCIRLSFPPQCNIRACVRRFQNIFKRNEKI